MLFIAPWQAFAGELSGEDWSILAKAEIIIFGEVHDNPFHHENQADAVAALAPGALVFEMLTPDLAARATAENRQNPRDLDKALAWDARGWPEFSMYFPIFAAAPEAVIIGGGLPREKVRRAAIEGAAKVFGEEAAAFGLDRDYDEDVQLMLEAEQQAAHCNALPAEMLPGMVEAQRLRDAALARAAINALDDIRAGAGSSPVVVITGNGHARGDFGVPSLLAILPDAPLVYSIGQFEGAPSESPKFDFWIVTDSIERPDPCEAFE